jgi:hypothetical protein
LPKSDARRIPDQNVKTDAASLPGVRCQPGKSGATDALSAILGTDKELSDVYSTALLYAIFKAKATARKEKGEGYSSAKGFFRQYELYYVVADERDVIRVRTNYRKDPPEDVYIYRVTGPIGNARRIFLEYMRRLNGLREHPEFYNTLTTNCTTNIWTNAQVNPGRVPLSWKILASGYVPEYLYEQERLETMGLSFPELQERAHVNARAQAADKATDFSWRIRN